MTLGGPAFRGGELVGTQAFLGASACQCGLSSGHVETRALGQRVGAGPHPGSAFLGAPGKPAGLGPGPTVSSKASG